MPAKVLSCALTGLTSAIIEVEADLTPTQLGNFVIVGLPDAAVQESRERIRSAIKNAGFDFPTKRISVNLAPADIKKQGPSFDVPIAVAIMMVALEISYEQLPFDIRSTMLLGELALDGTVRPVAGILPMTLAAKNSGVATVVVPSSNAGEAALVDGIQVVPINHIQDILACLENTKKTLPGYFVPKKPNQSKVIVKSIEHDMSQINGQQPAKRVLEIAAAGGHNVLMTGPPGSGKTLLARAVPGILPLLSKPEALEVMTVYSAAGALRTTDSVVQVRPFRSPHHTASGVALIGGGTWPRPGEVSLAHKGVLFLDEFPEFPRSVLEYLRQPLEEGVITISRAAGSWLFPAQCMLIAAMNPCPCGYYTDPEKECVCTQARVNAYQQRLSGPLLDRIDLFIDVPRLSYQALTSTSANESSREIRIRVEQARIFQYERNGAAKTNALLTSTECKKHCVLDIASDQLLKQAVESFHMSARGYYRTLRLARTVADLAGESSIQKSHVAESLQYRSQL